MCFCAICIPSMVNIIPMWYYGKWRWEEMYITNFWSLVQAAPTCTHTPYWDSLKKWHLNWVMKNECDLTHNDGNKEQLAYQRSGTQKSFLVWKTEGEWAWSLEANGTEIKKGEWRIRKASECSDCQTLF